MAPPKIMTGARAKVSVMQADGQMKVIGIFNNVSYANTFTADPAYILGRYAPAEIDYTAQEPVSITASGWRVVSQGPHVGPRLPLLQDLLRHEYLTFTVEDRQTGLVIATIEYVRPLSAQTGIAARQLTEVTMQFVGILCSDESGTQQFNEDGSATDLP